MASTYVNNLRLNEMATGDQSGTWGTTTNTNLELIGQALGWGTRAIANASTDNITIADGASDADRSMALKLTGGGQACTITLLPNTSAKVWVMENATAATLTFTAGSGANVAILAGETKMIATDGGGSGGVVYDVLTDLNLAGTTKTAALTNAGLINTATLTTTGNLIVGGNASLTGGSYFAAESYRYTDGTSSMTIGSGGLVTAVSGITSTASANTFGATSFNDANITNVGDIQLDSITGDGDTDTAITFSGSNVITVKAGNANQVTFKDGAFSPVADSDVDLGTSSLYFKDAYIDTVTTTGAITAASLDISGDVDVDGTLEADAITLNGTALGSLYSPIAGGSGIVTTGALNSGSITSGFGTINNGSSTITTTGAVATGAITAGGDITRGGSVYKDGSITDTGDFTLDVAGDIILDADGADINFKDGGTEYLRVTNGASGPDIFSTSNDADLFFKGVDGGSTITALTLDMSAAGAATFNNDVTAFSDERLKSNVTTIPDALSKVTEMRGVHYVRNETGKDSSGVIAQEMQKVAPELVLTADDEMGTLSVNYGNITGYLIEAIKELKAEIEELKAR